MYSKGFGNSQALQSPGLFYRGDYVSMTVQCIATQSLSGQRTKGEVPFSTPILHSDYAILFQPRYGVPVVSKLFEDFLSVGAQQRGWRDRLRVPACETESRAHHGNLAIGARRGLKVFDEVSLCDLRVFKDLGDG